MGYRIGFQCFETKEAATDYQMSQVSPTITANGLLIYPIKKGETWTYAGQTVDLSFGYCNPKQDFKDGLLIAGAYVSLFAAAFLIKFTVKFIWTSLVKEEERDNE